MQCRLALGLIAVFTLTATACGANAVPSDDVVAPKAVGTTRVEIVSRSSVGPNAETNSRLTGIVDYANDRSEYRAESSGCRSITIGNVPYIELPLEEGFPAGKRWLTSGDATESEALFEQSQKQTTSEYGITIHIYSVGFSMSGPAPDRYQDYLRASSGDPEFIDREDVRGVSTTHYRFNLDVRRLMRAELESAGWRAVNIDRYLEDLLEGEIEIDAWVDSEGLVRRIVTNETLGGEADGTTTQEVTTTEFFDFGVESDIQPPPAAEVMDSKEWGRITDERVRKWVDENSGATDEGIESLPGASEPSPFPGLDSEQPASCLH